MTYWIIVAVVAALAGVIYASWRWWFGRLPDEPERAPRPHMVPARRPLLEDGTTGRVEAFTHPPRALNRAQRRMLYRTGTTRAQRMAFRRYKRDLQLVRWKRRHLTKAVMRAWKTQSEERTP